MKRIYPYIELNVGRAYWDFHILPSLSVSHVKNERLGNCKFPGWTHIKFQFLCFAMGISIKNK